MSTKKIEKKHSFVDENNQRWLQCKRCYGYVKVDDTTGAITCSSCVVRIDVTKFPETIPQYKETKSIKWSSTWLAFYE